MPTVDVIFLKAPRWYCVAQWSDAFVARKRNHVKSLHSASPTQSHAHTHTHTHKTQPPTTTTTAHILGRTWHPNKSVVTAGQGSWDLNACLVLIWTSSWNTVWWQRARFPLGQSCSWRSTLSLTYRWHSLLLLRSLTNCIKEAETKYQSCNKA